MLDKHKGFTLVEMLVSIVLSTIIFVSSYKIISNLIQYQVRAKAVYEVGIDKYLIKNLVSQIISQSLDQNIIYYLTQKKSVFVGSENFVQLPSRAYDQHYDVPGIRVYKLFLRESELYVTYKKMDKDYALNEWFELPTGLKLNDIEFEYLDENTWVSEWRNKKKSPRFIRVTITLPNMQSFQWIRKTGYI